MPVTEDRRMPEGSDAEKAETVVADAQDQRPDPVAEKSWRAGDQQILPKNNLPLVFFSLLLATFLVGLLIYFWSCADH